MTLLNEYLYIDHKRLDSYAQQLDSVKKVVKLPSWKAKLGLTGPSIEGTQSSQLESINDHEKIACVIDKLGLSDMPDAVWETDGVLWDGPQFVLETHTAIRVTFPGFSVDNFLGMKVSSPVEVPPLAVWICENKTALGYNIRHTYLLEGLREDDRSIVMGCSSGTAFSMLLEVGFGSVCGGFLEEKLYKNEEHVNGLSRKKINDIFVQSPKDVMHIIGATYGPPRRIDSLFRIRAIDEVRDSRLTEEKNALTVIGYPIFVAEHPSTFLLSKQ